LAGSLWNANMVSALAASGVLVWKTEGMAVLVETRGDGGFAPAAGVAAIADVFPIAGPFFPPGEGPPAVEAGLFREVVLFHAIH
jgi:hypothetical protein